MPLENVSPNNTKHFSHKKEVFLVILILTIVLGLLYFGKPKFLPFEAFTKSNILGIISSLFVVAIFMERSVEAILIPVRTPDRKKLEQELEIFKLAAKTDESKKITLLIKEQELENYKLVTAKHALWVSFGFGLLISLVGIRTLAGLVEPEVFTKFGDMHYAMFSFVDIVLTGGVIAGGSAAIDKIGRKISENLKLTSAIDSNT